VLQISSLMMFAFSGLLAVATSILMAGSGREGRWRRAKPGATVIALISAVGLLLSTATVYLTYRPYWYIFHGSMVRGDWSQTRDLRDFLAATSLLPGVGPFSDLYLALPVYFWTGVTVLGVIGLAFIFLRHFLDRPRANGLQHSPLKSSG
jgi:hypothetical protein